MRITTGLLSAFPCKLGAGLFAASQLAACATAPAQRPVPEAPPIAAAPDALADPQAEPIVIAATDGIGASWSSVTDSQLTRTAAELSNLGGPIAVVGTVGAMLVADAKPKGRASRTAAVLNADVAADDLNAELVGELQDALVDADGKAATITVLPIDRARELPEDGWVVQTRYTLAEDGTALRVTAQVAHADDLRYAAEVERALQRSRYETDRYASYSSRRSRFPRRKTPPRWNGSFAYHSERLILPDTDVTYDGEQLEDMSGELLAALAENRAMRDEAARAAHAAAFNASTSESKRNRADRKLAKALAKSEALYTKSLEKARDEELSKMERLVLGTDAWRENDRLRETLSDAHDFLARAMAHALPGYRNSELQTVQSLPDVDPDEPLPPVIPLWDDEDGRNVVQVVQGPSAGLIVSVPESGLAEYGRSVAVPKN